MFPENAVSLDPRRSVLNWLGSEPAAVYAAVFFTREQARAFEHAQVLGNGGERHTERFRQVGHRGLALRQARENGAAGGIGERRKSGVQRRIRMLNHMV